MNENDIQLISKQYSSHFVTYEVSPGIYTIKNLSDAVYPLGDLEGTLRIEHDDNNMKTKRVLNGFGGSLRFDENSLFNVLLGFTPYWDLTPTKAIHANSISPALHENTSEKVINLSTIDETHLHCDVNDSFVVNGLKQPIVFTFVLDTPSGIKVFCELETIQYKKINKSV